MSAFNSAVRARCCATDSSVGVIVLRGRGEAERARTSLSRLEKVEFGAVTITRSGELGGAFARTDWTVTMGGGPVLHVEVALSCIVPSAAKGELTDTDCSDDFALWEYSLGEDISTAESYSTNTLR